MNKKQINKFQFFLLFLLFDLLVWSIAHVTAFNGYHYGEQTVGAAVFSSDTPKKSLDTTETLFLAETTYIDKVNLIIGDLPEDRLGYIKIQLEHGDNVLYTGYQSLKTINPNEWFPVHLGVSLKQGDQYRLLLTSNGVTSFPIIYLADDSTTPVLTYTYKKNLSVLDKVLVSIYYFVFYLIGSLLILKYKNICSWLKRLWCEFSVRSWTVGPYSIVNTLVAALVFYSSRLAVPDNTIFYFFEISILLSGLWFENNFRKVKDEYFTGIKSKTIIILLSLYAAFSIVGSRCFLYPINLHVSFTNVICFVCMAVVLLPLVMFLIYILGFGRDTPKNTHAVVNMPWKVYFFCMGIILSVTAYYIYAFNPAISSYDTMYCVHYAINSIHGMLGWHPPFYVLWLKFILGMSNSPIAVVLVQYIWFAFVFLEGMRLLYRRGKSSAFIILVTALTALNSANMVLLTTIWKDVPYAISVLWLTILIARFVLEDQSHKWFIYIELIIALVCTAFMRKNGIVIFIAILPVLLYCFRKYWKMWCACVLSVVLSCLIFFPLNTYLDIKVASTGSQYIGLGQDIMAVYYNGGSLNDEAMQVVNSLSFYNIAEYAYTPYTARLDLGQGAGLKVPDFIKAYIDTFIRNPVLMAREIFVRQDCVWNLLAGQDGVVGLVNYTGTADGTEDNNLNWNSLAPKRQDNFITELVTEYTAKSANVPFLNMIEWRAGVWTLLAIFSFCCMCFLNGNYKFCILFVTEFGHIISLVLSLGFFDYRFYYPLTLISLFLILLTLTVKKQERNYIQ